MADEGHQCPWCSADLGTVPRDSCPSCGAVLVEDPNASVPGVTTIDPDAVRRAATWERIRKRSTLRGFLEAGRDEPTESGISPSSLAALDPPSDEVRQEMVRIRDELDAAAEREARELEALKADALKADAEPLDANDGSVGGAPFDAEDRGIDGPRFDPDDRATGGAPFDADDRSTGGPASKPEAASP